MNLERQREIEESTPAGRSIGLRVATFVAGLIALWRSVGRWALTFAAPLVALGLVIHVLWILLPSDWFETRTLSTLNSSKLNGFARAIDGSMNFSIMSAAIRGAGLGAVVLSFVVLYRTLSNVVQGRLSTGVHRALVTLAALVVLGLAAWVGCRVADWEKNPLDTQCESSYGSAAVSVPRYEGFRTVVIDNVMCVAERSYPPERRVLRKTERMIYDNTYFGFIGASAVLAALGMLAIRCGNWFDVAYLRQRLADFRTLTLMAGVLFVLNALVTKSLVSWAQGLLASEDDAASFGRLGNALLNYWAAQASTVLIVALGLAAIFIQIDIGGAVIREAERRRREVQRHYTETKGDEDQAAAKWQKDNELNFDSATVVTATIGTIAPFLAGPAVDLVTKALH